MPKAKDTVEKKIYYRPQEWEKVCVRAEKLNMKAGTYIKVISVNGEIKVYDTQNMFNLTRSVNRLGANVNQIARVVNETKSVYQKDIEDLKKSMKLIEEAVAIYIAPLSYEELQE